MSIRTEPVTSSLLRDAFAHHAWATERLIDECKALTREQLDATVTGTYGSIIETLHHLVESDRWYLRFFPAGQQLARIEEKPILGLAQLRSEMRRHEAAWGEVLAQQDDPETDVPEQGDGWEFHAPIGFRLAQVIHHGTDHRSQVCTALTSLGIAPPEIDLWAYGEATGRTRAVTDRAEAIKALLAETEAAHGSFEATELKGVYDQDWARWYASYAVEHGIGERLGHDVMREQLAEFLAKSYADFEQADPKSSEPWTAYIARRIVEEL